MPKPTDTPLLEPSAIEPAGNVPSSLAPSASIVTSAAISAAIELGKDGVEVLERLHAIHKEERATAARASYHRAMGALKAELPVINKTLPGQHTPTTVATPNGTVTKGLYAPLHIITAALDPVASRHGFSYRFDRETRDGKDFVVCVVSHADGHSESSRFPAPTDGLAGKTPIQAIASGDTYAKRYALLGAFGITTADPIDDDGRGVPGDCVSVEQEAKLNDFLTEWGGSRTRFLAAYRAANLSAILAADYDDAVKGLKAKIAQKGAQKA